MIFRRILSPVFIIAGIVLFIFGSYVASQVIEGQQKIQKTQKGVNQACHLIKIDPTVHKIGKAFVTDPIRKKIADGREEVAQYQKLSWYLRGGGILSFAIGALLLLFVRKRK